MGVGLQIKRARKYRGLTQMALAEKAHISRSYIGDMERDRYSPSVSTLQTIADVLNVDIWFFFSNEKEPISIEGDELVRLIMSCPENQRKKLFKKLKDELKNL